MKYIKFLTYLNRFIFGATIILYATFFFGLFAQIVLGGYQILLAFILLLYYKKIQKYRFKQLIIYWSISLIYGCLWFFKRYDFDTNFSDLIFYILLPLGIASYFTFILESLKEEVL